MRASGVIAVGIALLAFAASAAAEKRYASVRGSGEACTQATPCDLTVAVEKAGFSDEVIVTAGTYTVTEPVGVPGSVNVHGNVAFPTAVDDLGAAEGPVPEIVATLPGQPVFIVNGPASTLSDVRLLNTGIEAVGVRCLEGSYVQRVEAKGVGEGAAGAVALQACTVWDSLLLGEGTNSLGAESLGIAAGDTGGGFRNVTAIATGENTAGIQSRHSGLSEGTHTLTLSNSIAQGESGLRTEDPQARIAVSHSNFDSVREETPGAITGTANQTATPLFIGPGDFRAASGSPTIDAGTAFGIDVVDLARNPRFLGAAPDIGAYEFVPPPPTVTLSSLGLSPKAFRAAKRGEAFASARKGKRAPIGTTVRYSVSAAATIQFTVERKTTGRMVRGKCRKRTPSNRTKKRCTLFKPLRSGLTHPGSAGQNRFRFSGRVRGKMLKPGRYRLVASAGGSVRRTGFRIVR